MELMVSLHGLNNVQRPTLNIDVPENGSLETARSFWSAITFESSLDPFDVCGKPYDKVVLQATPMETYIFFDAFISLMPGTKIGECLFVMIYKRCERRHQNA